MANVLAVQIRSEGFIGAPGYSTFHFEETLTHTRDQQFQAVKDFLDGLAGSFPSSWSAEVLPEGRVYDEENGDLIDVIYNSTGTSDPVAGAQSGGYTAGMAGAVISWRTATINRDKLIHGRTFAVPVAHNQCGEDGQLTTGAASQLTTHAAALIAADLSFSIWSRPRAGAGGKLGAVTAGGVRRTCATLRSRNT